MLLLHHLSYEFFCEFERHGDLKFLHEHSSILGSDGSSGRMNVLFEISVSLKTQVSQVPQHLEGSTLLFFILDFSFCSYSPSGLWLIELYVTILEYTIVDVS